MASKDKNVRFIRKNGRLIPIRVNKNKKDLKKGAVKAVASAAVVAGSAAGAAKLVNKSRPNFIKSAQLRGASKIVSKGTLKNRLIRQSAKAKIKGLTFQSRAGTLLGLGTLAASLLAGSAAGDIFKGDSKADEAASFISSTLPFLGVLAFKKFSKIKVSGKSVSDVFRKIQKQGQSQSRSIVKKFEKTAFKAGRVKKGDQLELFQNKNKDILKFLKGF